MQWQLDTAGSLDIFHDEYLFEHYDTFVVFSVFRSFGIMHVEWGFLDLRKTFRKYVIIILVWYYITTCYQIYLDVIWNNNDSSDIIVGYLWALVCCRRCISLPYFILAITFHMSCAGSDISVVSVFQSVWNALSSFRLIGYGFIMIC